MLTVQLSTLIFQLINFFILLGVLTWVFYRPLLRVMKQREDAIAARLRDAAEQSRQAAEERRRLADESSRLHVESEALLAKVRVEVSQSREHILERARQEAARSMEEAQQRLQERERAAQERLEGRLRQVAVTIAGSLIRQAAGPIVHQALLQRLIEEHVGGDSHEADLLRQALPNANGRVLVELAYAPSPDLEGRLQSMLGKSLGQEPAAINLDFRVESSLLAGVRVLVGTVAVDLSLKRILEELSQEAAPTGGTGEHGMGEPT
jgi:F-type H+-transporting ATPase subunit b